MASESVINREFIEIISSGNNLELYKKASYDNNKEATLIHNFIWYTAPNKYNQLLKKLINDCGLKVLHQWLENGSSLSLRCAENECYYHSNKHIYIDHRNDQITMYFQDNINQQSQKEPVQLICKDDYFKNLLRPDDEIYQEMKNKIAEHTKS